MNKEEEQQYCVAAQSRTTKKREPITGGTTYQTALLKKGAINRSLTWRKSHRYFHVAKFPYKSK